jgi:hypothetical protein
LTIRSVRANPLTGSLTVVHDGSAASRKAIMRTLEHFSRAPVEGEVPHPVDHAHGSGFRASASCPARYESNNGLGGFFPASWKASGRGLDDVGWRREHRSTGSLQTALFGG